MRALETLKISYCPLGNQGFRLIMESCPKLGRVTIEGCWISTMCLLGVVTRHPKLKLWKEGGVAARSSAVIPPLG